VAETATLAIKPIEKTGNRLSKPFILSPRLFFQANECIHLAALFLVTYIMLITYFFFNPLCAAQFTVKLARVNQD